MERIIGWKEKILGCCRYLGGGSRGRLGHWLVVIAGCACAVGCTTIKKAGITSIAAGGGALAGSVLSSGALAPMAGATATAFVADVVTEVKTPTGQIGKQAMSNCAPDNFWSLLGQLVETGGLLLLLVIIIPMIFSWLLPGPVKFKTKKE